MIWYIVCEMITSIRIMITWIISVTFFCFISLVLFPSKINPKVGLLVQKSPGFNFLRSFHIVVNKGCTIYTPINSADGFLFLQVLANSYSFSWSHSNRCEVLICIFLISDVKHLFMYLLTIYMSSDKCLFSSLPILKILTQRYV